MKYFFLLISCFFTFSMIGQKSFIHNLFFEASTSYSTTFNKSYYYSVSLYDLTNDYYEISKMATPNFGAGLGYSFSKSFEAKLNFRSSYFRNKTDGFSTFGMPIFENKVEISKVNTLSIITSYFKYLKDLKIELSLGLDFHRMKNNGDAFFYLGFKENSIATYISAGINHMFSSNLNLGFRTYCSNNIYGKGNFGINEFTTNGEYIPLTIGIEVFVKYYLSAPTDDAINKIEQN